MKRPHRPVTLTARLVATAVALVVLASVVIGLVATLATRSYLVDRLDDDVRSSLYRVAGPPEGGLGGPPPSLGGGLGGDPDGDGDRGYDDFRGAGLGTLSLLLSPSGASGGVLVQGSDGAPTELDLDADAVAALREVPTDGEPRDVDVSGVGSYRVAATSLGEGDEVALTGLPRSGVDAVVERLVVWEVVLAGLGALLAVGAGTVLVRRQLRPLREVADTAHAVSALPLDAGEIDLAPRVPERLTDERTEVGRVGAALNTMLAHVESSLDARHRSELQVRQFVADASHELRTPLATIAGYTELARRRPDDDVALRTALVKVEEESGRMTALVEDLLLLARLDAGRPLEQRRVDLTLLLVEAVADAQVLAPEHVWRLDLPDEPVEVLGDGLRLHQVVTNLLTNARKYTPPGTVVTVRARPEGFTVHDDGPGFAPEVAERAFERFVRADPARQRSGVSGPGGVGLGLALVRAVVTAHGGAVTLRSAPGDTAVEVGLPPVDEDHWSTGEGVQIPVR